MWNTVALRRLCWPLSVLMLLPLNGCTTVQQIENANGNLPATIRAQGVISPGDHVEIRTIGNEEYRFKVAYVDDEVVRGDAAEVPIDDIAELSVRKFSGGKTAGLVAVIVGLIVIVWIAVEGANNICQSGGCSSPSGI